LFGLLVGSVDDSNQSALPDNFTCVEENNEFIGISITFFFLLVCNMGATYRPSRDITNAGLLLLNDMGCFVQSPKSIKGAILR
jgi:hypothetical protein